MENSENVKKSINTGGCYGSCNANAKTKRENLKINII